MLLFKQKCGRERDVFLPYPDFLLKNENIEDVLDSSTPKAMEHKHILAKSPF